MKRNIQWRWLWLCPLLCGSLMGVSCNQLVKTAVFNGTLQFITGQVTNPSFPISDLVLGLITGQSSGGSQG